MRVPVDDAPAVDLVAADRESGTTEAVCINRGPNDAYVEFDANATSAASNLVKVDDYVSRTCEPGQRISAICAAGQTAVFHIFLDH